MSIFARTLEWTGIGLLLLFTSLGVLFVVGEAMDEPGGMEGAVLAASWVVPMLAVVALAWFRPRPATWVASVLVGAVAAFDLVSSSWDAFVRMEDQRGPVRAVAILATALPLAVLAVHRLRSAALLTGVLGVITLLLSFTEGPGSNAMGILGVFICVGAALLGSAVAVGQIADRRAERRGRGSGGGAAPAVLVPMPTPVSAAPPAPARQDEAA